MSDIDSQLDPNDQALERASGMEWNGTTLKPFSFLRKTVSMRLGMKWWKLNPDEVETITVEEGGEKGEVQIYDRLAEDVAIVLWLCSQDDETVRRARANGPWAQQQIDEWAEGRIFATGMELEPSAYVAFIRIVRDLHMSEFAVDTEKKTATPKRVSRSRKK